MVRWTAAACPAVTSGGDTGVAHGAPAAGTASDAELRAGPGGGQAVPAGLATRVGPRSGGPVSLRLLSWRRLSLTRRSWSPFPNPKQELKRHDVLPHYAGRVIRRVLALIAGGAILAILAVSTVGFALAAPVGMWVAAIVRRARGGSYTRRVGWVGAVLACSLVLVGGFAVALSRLPAGYIETVQQQAAIRQQREPSAIEQALRRVSSASPSQAAVEEKTRDLTRSKPFFLWITIMSSIVGAGIGGLLLGSMGWVGATLVMFGVTGKRQTPGAG